MQDRAKANPILEPLRQIANVLFWIAFYGLGALVLLLSLPAFGQSPPVAVFVRAAVGIWAFTLVLHVIRGRAAYVPAAIWVTMLSVPLAYRVVWMTHHWITIGMEGPGGQGSPMAFLFHFFLEWIVSAALGFMLALLVFARPWRAGRPAGIA